MTSLGGYLEGWAVIASLVGPAGWAAVETRRWLLGSWRGAWARLAESILAATCVLAAAEGLGTAAVLTRAGLVVFGTGLAVAALVVRRRPRRPGLIRAQPTIGVDRWAGAGAVVAVGAVSAQWVAWTAQAYRHGMTAYDALFYHSPMAARFAQTHDLTRLHSIVPGEAVTFFPATTEAWHALGMVAFRADLASPALNLVAFGVALLAAWCVGQRLGGGPVAVAGVALVSAMPYIAVSQPGSSFNDAAALAALLASLALLTRAADEPGAGLVGALAAGLAVGIKLSFVAPAVLVVLACAWLLPRARRLPTVAGWVAVMTVAGGYWYVRNLLRIGDPVPGVGFGLPAPALPVDVRYGARLLTSLDVSAHGWRTLYAPGLRDYFGGAWPAMVAVVLVALALAATGSRWHRVVGAALAVGLLAYAATPVSGDPNFFRFNLRYTLGLQGLAVLIIATHPRARGRWTQRALVLGALAAIAASWPVGSRDPFAFGGWPAGDGLRLSAVTVAVAVLGLGAAAWAVWRVRRGWAGGLAAAGVALLAVVVAGRGIDDRYARARFRALPGDLGAAWAWAQGVSGARIGVVGLYQQYPFYGARLDNYVQYVGVSTPHDGLARAPSCVTWRTAVDRGRYRYVVTSRDGIFPPLGEPPEAGWTRSDPAARQILHVGATAVFLLSGPLNPSGCPR